MKNQVVIIHGGDTFDNYEDYLKFLSEFEIEDLDYFRDGKNWKGSLSGTLGTNYEVLAPRMPNQMNSKYSEWKIWFEKLVPFLEDGVTLVGYSLGGTFLVKYLAENNFPKSIRSLQLVAPAFDGEGTEYSMGDFVMPADFQNVSRQARKIFLYQSTDDKVVPPLNAEKFKKVLPETEIVMFEDRGHFRQPEFPELLENIKN